MRVLYLSLLLGLSACQIIGDPKDPNESASDTSTVGPDTTSTSTSTSDTTETTDTTEGTEGTTLPTTGVTTQSPACDGLDELGCSAAADCRPVHGTPLDFPGCTPLPAFLGCIEDTDCDQALTTVCRQGSLEAYVIPDTCVPADFSACDPMLPECGAACIGLDEAACANDPNCVAHFGAPHVEQDMMVCADVANPQFLACDKLQDPCPPAVITVCPSGQPDVAFDVASGCVPPGFEPCMDGPVPECT